MVSRVIYDVHKSPFISSGSYGRMLFVINHCFFVVRVNSEVCCRLIMNMYKRIYVYQKILIRLFSLCWRFEFYVETVFSKKSFGSSLLH